MHPKEYSQKERVSLGTLVCFFLLSGRENDSSSRCFSPNVFRKAPPPAYGLVHSSNPPTVPMSINY